MSEKDLLADLDISEDEQCKWLTKYYHDTQAFPHDVIVHHTDLADLAFRLRDEVCKVSCENYYAGLEAVYNYKIKDKQCCSLYAFQTYQIKPIDMIIAALIAKDSK